MSEGTAQTSERDWLTLGRSGSSSDPDDSKPLSTSDNPDLNSGSTSDRGRKRRPDDSIDPLESRPQPDGALCPGTTSNAAPVPKKPLVGWPPVPTRWGPRKAKFVKVAVDGAPYQRKVDLEAYAGYKQLLAALQDKFASHFTVRKAGNEEMKLVDVFSGTEYVPTYEDKEGDLMLVGDVPWRMFVDACQRLRLMKSSEAVNLSLRASR